MTDPQRPDWVSQRAVAWVLDDAPVPAELLGTLVAIARRCDENGRGSYQSKPTLAERTGKSKDQVDADVLKLLDLGLIRLGDQTLPERNGVPPGRRPVVYDVALEVRGPKPRRAPRNRTGKNTSAPGTGGMDTGGGTDTRGGTDTPGRGGMDTPGRGGTDTPQTTHGNNPLNKPSLSPPVRPSRERDGGSLSQLSLARQVLTAAGADPSEVDALIPAIEAASSVRTPGAWWRAVAAAGDGPAVLAAGRKALADPGRAAGRQPGGYQPFQNEIRDEDYRRYADGLNYEQEPAA